MIVIKYSKLDGAEFIPHLDMLKHFAKIVRRMGVKASYSQGFNPHMLVFMSSPIALGLKSKSEYCLIDSDENASLFKELFNKFAPNGIKCEECFNVTKKAKIASDVTTAIYKISGLNKFDVNDVLLKNEFFIENKKGEQKEVRSKIVSLCFDENNLLATLKFGNDTLRPDYLANKLVSLYGGGDIDIVKEDARFLDGLDLESYLKVSGCFQA
ncbi:MAG: DUF2344 domain-containing protein [Clostridia bacterium]|nr:DUF2344 domain-containing protein [Clostridia bacterium]